MRTAVYLCSCGGNIADRVDLAAVAAELSHVADVAYVKTADFPCSADGQQWLEDDLRRERPDRVVMAACSPREYETTFREALQRAGINPYFLQMANVREQVAWVTEEAAEATVKALAQIRGAVARVAAHEPLEKTELEVCGDVLVVGAGPAGLKCALALAEAGRKVTVVEKSPALGGLPAQFEEVFPALECAPCMLEPMLGEALHGPHAANFDVLTLAELADVAGYCGNFTASIRVAPRGVDTELCIGCGECVAPCPTHAMTTAYAGALPNAPFVDAAACVRTNGEDCTACRDACPVEGAVILDGAPRAIERQFGAIVLAIGAGLYGGGRAPGVYSALEFERLLASNGPTGGDIGAPESVAIVHCAGSLDEERPYCSGVCCQYAFKFNRLIAKKRPGTKIYHFYKELAMAGKGAFELYRQARDNPDATFLRYGRLRATAGRVEYDGGAVQVDMVVLCPAVTGAPDAPRLGALLDAPRDRFGFFEPLHARLDAAQSPMRGVYLAGACESPMDIQQATARGMAAAGHVLAGLSADRKLEIEPITARVNEERCSLCRTCGLVCPYKAIGYPADRASASVNGLLCRGCGTCVAACPSGALEVAHFTSAQILAEMGAVLQ